MMFVALVCSAGILYAQPLHGHRQENYVTDTLIFHGKEAVAKQASLPKALERKIQFKKSHKIQLSVADMQEIKKAATTFRNNHPALSTKGVLKTSAFIFYPSIIVIDDTTRSLYAYDQNGNQLMELDQTLAKNQWVNSDRWSYSYDAEGRQLSTLGEQYYNGAWVVIHKDSVVFDNHGNGVMSFIFQYSLGVLLNETREIMTYDANGNQLTRLWEVDTNGTWNNSFLETWTYDLNNQMLSEFDENCTNGAWVYSTRYTYTYDGSGRELTDQCENYTNGAWSIDWQDSVAYDSKGNELSDAFLGYSHGIVTDGFRTVNTFDDGNKELTSIFESLVNGVWQVSSQDTYTYDENGYPSTDTTEAYTGGKWVLSEVYSQTHDAHGNPLTTQRENFKNDSLTDATKTIYTYNGFNEELTENGSSLDTVWTDDYSVNYTYDEYGNALHGKFAFLSPTFEIITFIDTDEGDIELYDVGMLTMYYDGGVNSMYCNGNAVDISYISITGVPSTNGEAYSFSLGQNFPNPFNPTTVISYQLPTNTLVTLKVYDILGRLVKTLVEEQQALGNHSVTFNAINLSSGVYFYRFTAGSYVNTKKLMLLK